MKKINTLLAVAALGLFSLVSTFAENWPNWRGPHYDGSSKEKNFPYQWSKGENIAWIAEMPGPSAATPIVWGDYVFVSSTEPRTKMLQAICLDRRTGRVLWQREPAAGYSKDPKSNFASPSPVTDGVRVIFFYGNGELVSYNFKGGKEWARNIQKDYGDFAFLWTFASSPLLYRDKLYLQVLQRDVPVDGRGFADRPNESYLLALNPRTGETLWRHIRPSEAVAESREAFTTPIPFEHRDRAEILIAGGDSMSGHDPETGRELWRWGTWNPKRIGHWRLVPSPVTGDGVILACAPKREPVFAIKAGGSGVLDNSHIIWNSSHNRDISADVPTPLFYESDFFILNDLNTTLSRVEPKTGLVKWTTALPRGKKFEASPLGVDGKIYLMNFAGDVVVVSADKGNILRTIPMGDEGDDEIRSSVVASQGQLFIRTNRRLYCVGESTTPQTGGR